MAQLVRVSTHCLKGCAAPCGQRRQSTLLLSRGWGLALQVSILVLSCTWGPSTSSFAGPLPSRATQCGFQHRAGAAVADGLPIFKKGDATDTQTNLSWRAHQQPVCQHHGTTHGQVHRAAAAAIQLGPAFTL